MVISWRSVTHLVFPGFLTLISFQSHQLLFSHASAEVKGENTLERKISPQTGLKLATTRSWVLHAHHWAIRAWPPVKRISLPGLSHPHGVHSSLTANPSCHDCYVNRNMWGCVKERTRSQIYRLKGGYLDFSHLTELKYNFICIYHWILYKKTNHH